MVRWTVAGTNQVLGDELPSWVQAGWLPPHVPVSADGGRTWIPATEAVRRLYARGDDIAAMFVPMRTATFATVAQYTGLFSLLFFGGPLCLIAMMTGFDPGTMTVPFRVCFFAAAILLGPSPIALFAWLGRREIKRDPTLRGNGRIVFALVCAALMAVQVFVGMVASAVR